MKSTNLKLLIIILSTFLGTAHAYKANDKNTLKIPMPNGLTMKFIPVCVSSDKGFFNWKTIKLGDPAGGFKEYPTVMALGGSFPLKQNGKRMWCYYMGEHEVTQQQ